MRRKPAYRLHVETLEDRLAPSTTPAFNSLDYLIHPLPNPNQVETEPNNSIGQANQLYLFQQYQPFITHVDVATPYADMLPILSVYPPRFYDPVSVGGIRGSLDGATADTDFFRLTTYSQSRITLIFSGDAVSNNSVVQLLDADGNVLATGQRTAVSLLPNVDAIPQATLSYFATKGGTFYVRIGTALNAASPASGAYTLGVVAAAESLVEHEPNDTPAQANPIVMLAYDFPAAVFAVPYFPRTLEHHSGNIRGSLNHSASGNDVDYFNFNADANRRITLNFNGVAAEAGASLELLDGAGRVVAVGQASSLSYYTKTGGTFFVRISAGDSAASGAYYLNASIAADPFVEHESNDNFAEANPLWLSHSFFILSDPQIPYPWYRDYFLSGHTTGDLAQHEDGAADRDFFSFTSVGSRSIYLELQGNLAGVGGRISLFDASHRLLATGADALRWNTYSGGTFFVRIDQLTPATGATAAATSYRLGITTTALANLIEGASERESNDTMAEANPLYLQSPLLFDLTNNISRAGAALGVAGGPSGDRDFFRIDVRAGEHVHIGVDGYVRNAAGNVYSSLAEWIKADRIKAAGLSLAALLKAHPGVLAGSVQITVFDSNGRQVGASSDNGAGAGGVAFNAVNDGTYYVRVTAGAASLVHYRLSVNASSFPAPLIAGVVRPFVKVLQSGQAFVFTDASGHRVRIAYQGMLRFVGRHFGIPNLGSVTITFTGNQAKGSNIASIVVNNADGGSLAISGGARIGKLIVHGKRQPGLVIGSLDRVSIAGDVGVLISDTTINSVIVTGSLGSVSAPQQRIGFLRATDFDTALLRAAVTTLQVKNDPNVTAKKLLMRL